MSAVPPRRLLVITNSFEDDAPNRMAFAVARVAQRQGGFRVGMLALSRGGVLEPEIDANGITCSAGGRLGGLPHLYNVLGRFQPHLVHFHLTRPTISGVPIARLRRVPVIVATHHGAHEWWERGRAMGMAVRWTYPAVAPMAQQVIAVSHAAREELRSCGIGHNQTSVIHNGIDTMKVFPGSTRARYGLLERYFPTDSTKDATILGCGGNLRRVKGHAVLLDAVALLVPKYPAVRLVIWGEGPERAALERRITSHGLEAIVKLAGHSEALTTELAGCDIFVQPSRSESFGLAAAEAMACGKPVVLSQIGGLPELGGDAAVYAQPGNAKSLAGAIESLLVSETERRRRGIEARNRILLNFSQEKMCRAHLDLYQSLLTETVS